MLTRLMLFGAQTGADLQEHLPPQRPSKLLGLSLESILVLLGVLAIIALGLYLFAYLTRRRHRRHLSRSGRDMWRAERQAQQERRRSRVRVRKKRRDHPDYRPRNPTLEETGGLPPVRPDEPAQPA